MTHVKKLTMHGFKSFASKTEIKFDQGINTIVGPNGSGKSNISDALCFVLGRLSAKSMRATKAKNLLFMGSKFAKPAQEAYVELIFDNQNKTFAIQDSEIILKRIVKKNGQSTYKINNETKTRTEVLETLAHAGIDPNGFNLILQGNIQSIVKMHSEERRKVIEEVAGISVYEIRKEKSLKELDKTEARLKEISTILRERTAFMNNLERERAEALKFKSLEGTIKRCKASILKKKLDNKNKELESLRKSIQSKIEQKEKIKSQSGQFQKEIDSLNEKIIQINKHIQKSTGLEQETLHTSIANLKAEITGLSVRKENYESRSREIENRINQMQKSIPELEFEIKDLRKESPLMAKKQEQILLKKKELERIQEERKAVYTTKTKLSSIKERLKDKQTNLGKLNSDSETTLKQLEELSSDLKCKDEKECQKIIEETQKNLEEIKLFLRNLNNSEIQNEKIISISENKITEAEKIKSQLDKLDICPLCQTKITEDHINHVIKDSDFRISHANESMKNAIKDLDNVKQEKEKIQNKIQKNEIKLSDMQKEITKHQSISEKNEMIRKTLQDQESLKSEISELESKRELLEAKTLDSSIIEEAYSTKLQEIEEISSRTEENLDTTLLYKERELERIKDVIKRSSNDLKEMWQEIEELSSTLEEKQNSLEKLEEDEQKLNQKFKQLFKERDSLQENIKEDSYKLSESQTGWSQIEEQVNYLKVGNAKLEAEREAVEMELKDFPGIELIKASLQILEEKLIKSQDSLNKIGSINLRALEVYEQVKEEYDKVKEKSENIEKEKGEILKIIYEIDRKKKKTFMKTFKAINDLFSENFSRLYTKGQAYLELEDKSNPFEAGVNIVIRLAKGKYFDITSLSGGEQTMVAISLLFAIQEYKPYHFYIFDEIDAALDKRNSQRLSGLLKQYMKNGQYIVITHNDAIITDSNILYGVSMHEGISKVLSLKLD